MEIFIYWFGQAQISRANAEDTIEEILGDKGEVTGAGLGEHGANIDVEIFDDADATRLLPAIARALAADLPANAYFHVADDEAKHLLSEHLPS